MYINSDIDNNINKYIGKITSHTLTTQNLKHHNVKVIVIFFVINNENRYEKL